MNPTRAPREVVVLSLLAAAAAAPLAMAGRPSAGRPAPRPPVSGVIYPAQDLPLVFSHARHLPAVDADCAACHPAAWTSRSALDSLIPGEDACAACHAIDRDAPDKAAAGRPPAACVACHAGFDRATGFVPRVRIPPPNLKFDHRGHVVDGRIPCARCHGDLAGEGVGLATRAQLPAMALCLSCHDGGRAPARCTLCHLAGAGGRMRTSFAGERLAPGGQAGLPAHGPDFATRHGAEAGAAPGVCRTCHSEESCTDCHAGVVKPFDFHPGDYLALHALDARRGTPDCTTCHRLQTFCVGCHTRAGVAAGTGGSEFVPTTAGGGEDRRFHPRGWVEVLDAGGLSRERGPRHHAFEAQRNLRQCASCHRESFCLTCHSGQPGSPQVNPHPGDWAGSRRCQALLQRNRRVCLRCHTTIDEVSCEL